MFIAELGKGVVLNGNPIKVSSTNSLSRGLLCTGFPYDVHESEDNNLDHFENLVKVAQAIRRDGSAALDLCYVAMGRFDGFWEMKLKPWDIAAGYLVVTESGGKVTGFNGMSLDITKGDVLASNSLIHKEMAKVLSLGRRIDK
jgi:myo-inositol-1(or 4)-monophosphatase